MKPDQINSVKPHKPGTTNIASPPNMTSHNSTITPNTLPQASMQQHRKPNKVLKLDMSKVNKEKSAVFCANVSNKQQSTTTGPAAASGRGSSNPVSGETRAGGGGQGTDQTGGGMAPSAASNKNRGASNSQCPPPPSASREVDGVTMATGNGSPPSRVLADRTNSIKNTGVREPPNSLPDGGAVRGDKTEEAAGMRGQGHNAVPEKSRGNKGQQNTTPDAGMVLVQTKVKKRRVNPDMTQVRPENLDTNNVKTADHYFNMVNYQCDDAGDKQTDKLNRQKSLCNSRLLSIMHTKERPAPKLYLFKFHASVSQSTIDGRNTTTTACAIICMYFAQKFHKDPTEFPTEGQIKTLPDKIFRQVERAIREGNQAHELNYKGETVNLGPEEVILLTSHLGIEHAYETDIDTRELDTLVPAVMQLKGNQSIMLIKNCRVVSLVPCNDNEGLLLFDSHPHFVITASVRKVYGAYLFYAQKEESVVKDLIMSYDTFCDSTPFYGKLVIFNM